MLTINTINTIKKYSGTLLKDAEKWSKQSFFKGLKYEPELFVGDTVEISQKSVKSKTIEKILSPDAMKIELGTYETGIKDNRISQLGVTKRVNFPVFDKSEFPISYLFEDANGMIRQKPHLYFNLLEVKPEFARQGAGTAALKRVMECSKNEGYEGRVMLDAIGFPGTKTYIPSPALQTWKLGFRFIDENKNKIMEEVQKGIRPLTDAPVGTMYIPV